jgi:hypothetical protein
MPLSRNHHRRLRPHPDGFDELLFWAVMVLVISAVTFTGIAGFEILKYLIKHS